MIYLVCGGQLYAVTGSLTSPGYPDHYPHDRDCTWVIHAAPGHQIKLNFTDFQLEEHQNCEYDYLEIR